MKRLLAPWLVLVILSACSAPSAPTATPTSSIPPTPTPVVQRIPDEGQGHVPEGSPIQYKHYPPSSGSHYPRWARYEAYAEELPEGYWVHNLEHGAIVVLYNCRSVACPEVESTLKGLYSELKPSKWGSVKLVVTPYTRSTAQVTVLAWGYQMDLSGPDVNSIRFFYNAHVDQGPEDAP